jgi:transcriptional regulator with PAS, ATPase and Fis domain
MLEILSVVDKVKESNLTVLITGETGTGKDLLARHLHQASSRASGPFQIINSASIPETLLEAELFGRRKGSFTGADRDKAGLIELANGGSFCFDEIGELPLHLQVKLLRVLDDKKVRRLGGHEDVHLDLRFIALTNRNLADLVMKGAFRDDLFYRLQSVPLHLPPLRERKEDIPLLLRHFLTEMNFPLNGLPSQEFEDLFRPFEGYSWPGNIRELLNLVRRSVKLVSMGDIKGLVEKMYEQLTSASPEDQERLRLMIALARNHGNRARTARELKMPVTTLKSQLKKLKL